MDMTVCVGWSIVDSSMLAACWSMVSQWHSILRILVVVKLTNKNNDKATSNREQGGCYEKAPQH